MAKLIQVIESYEQRGTGTEDDPVRSVKTFYSLEGLSLMSYDPHKLVHLTVKEYQKLHDAAIEGGYKDD